MLPREIAVTYALEAATRAGKPSSSRSTIRCSTPRAASRTAFAIATRELEDAVAEELEPLVGRCAVVGPRRVREHLLQPMDGKLRDQAAELARRGVTPDER